jgi:hypothetical protein
LAEGDSALQGQARKEFSIERARVMANENTSGPQKQEPGTPKTPDTKKAEASTSASSQSRKTRAGGKGERSRMGGTAVPGAKSTLPKPPSASNDPNQQQVDSSNRTMRRRMQQIKAGPYAQEQRMQTLQERRQKRVERRKQRVEEQRQELRKSVPGGKISLGRRNTYFIVAIVVLIILLIVLFVVLRQLHIIP